MPKVLRSRTHVISSTTAALLWGVTAWWRYFVTGQSVLGRRTDNATFWHAATKDYRCPGCDQPIPPATPHVVAWPVEGSTIAGGGLDERRHWHRSCWDARGRRRPR